MMNMSDDSRLGTVCNLFAKGRPQFRVSYLVIAAKDIGRDNKFHDFAEIALASRNHHCELGNW